MEISLQTQSIEFFSHLRDEFKLLLYLFQHFWSDSYRYIFSLSEKLNISKATVLYGYSSFQMISLQFFIRSFVSLYFHDIYDNLPNIVAQSSLFTSHPKKISRKYDAFRFYRNWNTHPPIFWLLHLFVFSLHQRWNLFGQLSFSWKCASNWEVS